MWPSARTGSVSTESRGPHGGRSSQQKAIVPSRQDPTQPGAIGGFVYEIDPVSGLSTVLPAVGSRLHEGLRFDKSGNLYGISENNPGYIFRFVPTVRGDLSNGQLYALRIVEDLGDRTGWGVWEPLDGAVARIDSDAAAAAAGATGYARPEDIETSVSTGNDRRGGRMLYAAITSENRVIAIDLLAATREHKNQVFVSDYVRNGVNTPAGFNAPDNLALDLEGNLFISEDPGGTAPSTLGDDVWLARLDPANQARSQDAVRFFSITDRNAEPTGIYFSPSGRTLFVNVQHRGGDGRDGAFAIQKISGIKFDRTGVATEQ